MLGEIIRESGLRGANRVKSLIKSIALDNSQTRQLRCPGGKIMVKRLQTRFVVPYSAFNLLNTSSSASAGTSDEAAPIEKCVWINHVWSGSGLK